MRQARIRQIRNWCLGAVAAVIAFVVYSAANAPTGVTAVEGWDLPGIGPTAEIQEHVALADFLGSPAVVNFFASWCDA